VSECLCCEAETGEQASTADWPQHDVEMVKLVNKLSDNHSLTGDHERIVKRVDIDRMIIIHEVAHLCINTVPIFDHVHLSPIAQNRTTLCVWQRTVGASRHARWLPEDDRPAQVLAHIP
jgi:hypothetical protein